MKRLRATVHGLVQGVFFRAHTREQASRLKLTGFVRNLPNGSVEVVAEGEEKELQQLLIWLNKGPSSARVEKVDAKFAPATQEFDGFEVVY